MKFGIFLPLQNPHPERDGSDHQLIAEALEQAELADRAGYDCVWTQEHHFLEAYSHASAPEVLLAAISQRTKRIRIGHGVMLTAPAYNHPARCAERIAMLDHVSGGRVEWGTGSSGTRIELDAFGIDASDKHAQWREGLHTALRLLTENPFEGVSGRFVQLPRCNLVPKALQRPHPPLWMACSNRASLRVAARLGLGALTFAFVDPAEAKHWVDEYYSTFETECRPIGRAVNPNLAMLSNFFCDPDRERAQQLGRPGAEFFAFGLRRYFHGGAPELAGSDLWAAFTASQERPFVQPRCFDTPEALAAHFRGFEQAGVDQIILLQQAGAYQHAATCASLERFATRALPEFKARDAATMAEKQRRLAPAIARALQRDARDSQRRTRPPDAITQPRAALTSNAGVGARDVPPQPCAPPDTPARCRTLIDLLQLRAAERPDQCALCALDAQARPRESLSYAALAQVVATQARVLTAMLPRGGRVLILGDLAGAGLAPITTLLATLRAGAVGVPHAALRREHAGDTLRAILTDLGPDLIVGPQATHRLLRELPEATGIRYLSFEALSLGDAGLAQVQLPRSLPELALMQYTSGSLQAPKAVAISHAMALASLANTSSLFGFTSADRFLSIVPLHHTLSLFVHAWSALYHGAICYTLDPVTVAADPAIWLRAISAHAITVSGAPNFAYARCAGLNALAAPIDLSRWRLAINGGEPVQCATIDAFCERWRGAGFARAALVPSYGMTEACGTITGQRGADSARLLSIASSALRRAARRAGAPETRCISNGRIGAGSELAVVDPETHKALNDGEIGELWLRGPSIATQYAGHAADVQRFAALADQPHKTFLRTGDLGMTWQGEVAVLGRLRELICVRGDNVLPEEVESVACQSCPELHSDAALALGVEEAGTHSLALLLEVPSTADEQACTLRVREAVARRLGLHLAHVVCLPCGGLPRSTSGKRRRAAARALLAREAGSSTPKTAADDSRPSSIEGYLEQRFCELLERSAVPHDRSFFALGGDSLHAAELLAQTNARFAAGLTLGDVIEDFSIERLAARLRADSCIQAATGPGPDTLREIDGMTLRLLDSAGVPAAARCLADAFMRLPMVQALPIDRTRLETFMHAQAEAAAKAGLSIALFDGDVMVGCGLCEDYEGVLRAALGELPDQLAAGVAVQAALDRRYVASAGAPREPTLHMNLLALDRAYEGRALPAQLIDASIDLAVTRGFRAAIAHAASPVVQALLSEQFAFTCVARQPYASFVHRGTRPFAALPASSALMLMARSLRDWRGRTRTARGPAHSRVPCGPARAYKAVARPPRFA